MYGHIFFDLDHTLWDFEENSRQTLLQVYEHCHLNAKGIIDAAYFTRIYNRHNERLWVKYRKGVISRNDLRIQRMQLTLADFKIADEELAATMGNLYLALLPLQTKLMPYAEEVLMYCNTKYAVHLITNGFEATQLQKLQNSRLHNYFKAIITSEGCGSMKPKKEIFEYAEAATKARKEECLMIGDTPDADITGAKKAGWHQVYYNPAKLKHSFKPTYEVSCLSQLLQIL